MSAIGYFAKFPSKEYLAVKISEHKRATGETNRDIGKKLRGRPGAEGVGANFISMLMNPNEPATLAIDRVAELCVAVPTLDARELLKMRLKEAWGESEQHTLIYIFENNEIEDKDARLLIAELDALPPLERDTTVKRFRAELSDRRYASLLESLEALEPRDSARVLSKLRDQLHNIMVGRDNG